MLFWLQVRLCTIINQLPIMMKVNFQMLCEISSLLLYIVFFSEFPNFGNFYKCVINILVIIQKSPSLFRHQTGNINGWER